MRLRVILYTIFIFVIALLQSTILDYLKIYNVKPDLLLIFIVGVALLRGSSEGAVIGFFAGLAHDIISGKVLGFYALLGIYLGLINGMVNKRLYRENFMVVIFFTFISTLAYEMAVGFFNMLLNSYTNILYALKHIILPEAIYNSLASVIIFVFIVRMNRKFEVISNSQRKY